MEVEQDNFGYGEMELEQKEERMQKAGASNIFSKMRDSNKEVTNLSFEGKGRPSYSEDEKSSDFDVNAEI